LKSEFKIGYCPSSIFDGTDVLRFAKKIDKHDRIDSIWIPESWGREAFVMLGAISQLTRRINLGTSILNIYSRTPATVAMAASTLDNISSNRSLIGLGASTPILVRNWHGLEFRSPLLRMKEFLECVKEINTGSTVNYNGKFFSVSNFKLMQPSPRKSIPLLLAAVNKGMINLATRVADGIILYLRPRQELNKVVNEIHHSTIGRKNFQISCVFITSISQKYPDMATDRAAMTLAFYVAVGKYYGDFLSKNGFENEVESIKLAYANEGIGTARKFVSDKMLDSLAIHGDCEMGAKMLNKFIQTGISYPILQINPVVSPVTSIKDALLLASYV